MGGVGLINFIVFPVASNKEITYIEQTQTPKLYNQLYTFFNNFENTLFVYPIAHFQQEYIQISDKNVFTNKFIYSDRINYHLPESNIDFYIRDNEIRVSFDSYYDGNRDLEIVYSINTKEIYTRC